MHCLQSRNCTALTASNHSWTSVTARNSYHSNLFNRKENSRTLHPGCSRSISHRQRCLQFGQRGARRSTHCQASVLELAAILPGICFDQQCQQAADRAFLIVTAVPLLGLLVAVILRYKPISPELLEKAKVFSDPSTGSYFNRPEGIDPERDKKGELAFRPVSYTPWPVEAGAPGERIRIDVGPTSDTSPRTFVFERRRGNSDILKITLPRPMGLIFEEDRAKGHAVIADFVKGSDIAKRAKVAKLNQSWKSVPRPGDVLRACTCTNMVYATQSLFGAKAPVRTIVVYGADNQKWPKVVAALRAGDESDGDVTLVLERQKEY